ncbi:MAG: helix-turn-helix transcriptional regulator [Reyranellaceae bacterium]
MARLQATDILPILRRLDAGESSAAIASDFGVAASTINLIRRGSTWRHEIAAARMMIAAAPSSLNNRKPGTNPMMSKLDHATSLRQLLDTLPPAGQLVRRARELRGMSQLDVASRIGCKPNFVSMVEDARSALPPKRAPAWARAVGLPPAIVVLRTMVGKHEGLQVAIAELAALSDEVLPCVEQEIGRVRQILDGSITA